MKNSKLIVTACLYALIGALFIILKGGVLNILMTIIGVAAIIWGIIDLANKNTVEGIIKIVVGIAIILLGWLAVSIVLYILGILLIIYGIVGLYNVIKTNKNNALAYVEPILALIVGILLIFAQGQAINVIFIICGVILIIDAIILFISAFSSNPQKKSASKSGNKKKTKKK